MKRRITLFLTFLFVLFLALPSSPDAYSGNKKIRTLRILVLTDGKVPVSRIHKEISNANSIIEDQVYTRLEVVDVVKLRWKKKKGQQIMKQLRRKADRLANKYDYDIAIAYIRLKNGRKFMGKCAGRYILVRATEKGCGIVTAHEIGHSFVGSRHDSMGLMSTKAIKKKDTAIMNDTAFRWKNNRWRNFN